MKRRSFITVSILTLGSTGLILIGGFFENLTEGLREQFIHSQVGHLQVSMAGYYARGARSPLDYLMQDVPEIEKIIRTIPHVSYTVPRLKFSGILGARNSSIAVMAFGVDPVLEHRMGSLKFSHAKHESTHIVEGSDLDPADPYGIIVGNGLLKALGLQIGDSVSFLTTRRHGTIDGDYYHIRGVFETVIKDFDDRAIKINLVNAQKVLGIPDQVHSLLVILDKTENTLAAKDQLDKEVKKRGLNLESITWDQQGFYYRQSKALLDRIYFVIQIVLTIIFFFSIMNTISMSVFERMREFGTMMAIGNTKLVVFSTIVFEGVILGLIGAVMGLGVGCIMAKIISSVGIEMPPPPQATYGYFAMISLNPSLLCQTVSMAFVSSLFASFLPGYRASNFKIVEALEYV
jgi:putative ABC transport system permease protein